MATDILHPEEWLELSSAIQAGENVGSRLMERERRFDNYFKDLTDSFTPQFGQRDTTLLDVGYTFVTTSATSVRGMRIGQWVMLSIRGVASSSLAFGANASGIAIAISKELGMESSAADLLGTFGWRDASAGTNTYGFSTPVSLVGYGPSDETFGVGGVTTAGAGIGAAVNLSTSDQVWCNIQYRTARSKSLA